MLGRLNTLLLSALDAHKAKETAPNSDVHQAKDNAPKSDK
jgi:hypothetical protein